LINPLKGKPINSNGGKEVKRQRGEEVKRKRGKEGKRLKGKGGRGQNGLWSRIEQVADGNCRSKRSLEQSEIPVRACDPAAAGSGPT